MAKVLVLYYSACGHIETMAYAVAEGAKSAGAEVTVKGVPDLVPEEMGVDEIKGGSPHGASTITDGGGSRQPSAIELEAAKAAHVAKIAAKLG
ncbi:hypothetical protein AJ87_26540 [Rhizobium yanglingense]|nr:hypothetical protein AJ87_26540 [Rhizobium yanglingense]